MKIVRSSSVFVFEMLTDECISRHLNAKLDVAAGVAFIIRITRIIFKFIPNALFVYQWDRFSFQGRLIVVSTRSQRKARCLLVQNICAPQCELRLNSYTAHNHNFIAPTFKRIEPVDNPVLTILPQTAKRPWRENRSCISTSFHKSENFGSF